MATSTNKLIEYGNDMQTFADLKKALPYTDCRFAVFDHDVKTADGRQTSKLWFISWLPNNSTPYHKMAYTVRKIYPLILQMMITVIILMMMITLMVVMICAVCERKVERHHTWCV